MLIRMGRKASHLELTIMSANGRQTLPSIAVLLIALVIFGHIQANAVGYEVGKTYYMDSIDGDDSNSGLSPESAWKSIERLVKYNAASSFLPCDSILFKRGATFYSSIGIQFKGSGTPDCPITIGAYDEGVAPIIIVAGPEVKPWESLGTNIWLWRYSGNVVNGLWEDAQPLHKASNESLSDGQWYFKKGVGIYYRPSGDSPLAHIVHRATPGSGFAFSGNAYITIRDLHFLILGLYLSPKNAPVHDFLIVNNKFENIITPIQLFSRSGREISDITISKNHLRKVGYGVRVHAANGVERAMRLRVVGNVIMDIDEEQIYTTWSDGFYDNEALSFQNINNSEISDNYISGGGALGGGIVQWTNPKSSAHRNSIVRNFICNISGTGMGLFNSGHKNIHQQNLIRNNIICNLEQNKVLVFPARGKAEGMGGMRLNGYDTTYSNKLYNNTIFAYDHNVLFNSFAVGWVLKNNLSAKQTASHVWRKEGKIERAEMDFNLYSQANKSSFLVGVQPAMYGILRWRAQGADKNSIVMEPMFENTSSTSSKPSDFMPRWDSPVIDAGTVVDAVDEDYFKNPIYGPRDIGAIEYQPPYLMGVDPVDTASDVRVYGDGMFRNTKPPGGNVARLSVRPLSNNTREWIDISITDWGSTFSWSESSSTVNGPVAHRLGGLSPNAEYTVTYVKDGILSEVLGAHATDSTGSLAFTYGGEMTTVGFTVAPRMN